MNSNEITYRLIRSARKSIELVVDDEGTLIVRAPRRAAVREIESIINRHAAWILEKQQLAREKAGRRVSVTLEEGSVLPYLGRSYQVRRTAKTAQLPLAETRGSALTGNAGKMRTVTKTDLLQNSGLQFSTEMAGIGAEGCFFGKEMCPAGTVSVPAGWEMKQVQLWLKQAADGRIRSRVKYYETVMGVESASVRMSEARTRWGSCSGGNRLNFSWRLIFCPPEVIDYVVVHELRHIINKDHSRYFWAGVEQVLPDYRIRRQWLKENGGVMELFRELNR